MKIEGTYIATFSVMAVIAWGLRWIWLAQKTELPGEKDVQPADLPEKHMDDLQDEEKISITICSEQAKYYNGPPSPYDNMK